jgi:carboxyl-terminal processing protease
LAGIYLGQRIAGRGAVVQIDTSRELSKLELVFRQIHDHYVDTVNAGELIENTLPMILETLDPHSVYIPADDMAQANESIEGNFDGIGIAFNMANDTVVVMNVVAGGPSERSGIQPGDRIITVNDSVIAGKNLEQNRVVKMLRGPRDTRVQLGIARMGEAQLIAITVVRGKIPVKSMDAAYMVNDRTGYIKLSKFSKTTHEEFITALQSLRREGMTRLVLDLRGNGGGLLEQAFEVANDFLEQGNLIVYTEGRVRPRYDYFANGKGRCKDLALAVLIDETSASASEIVAGALQDNDRGLIVGRRSFGKGLVQEPVFFSDNSGLRLTVARYYTPTGRSIQKPYTRSNKEAYENELQDRFLHGEMSSSDSSKVVSGEQFHTPQGKVVYGGGGIMPDVFVPMDTSAYNSYYTAIYRKNLIYRFALQFVDRHRKELNTIRDMAQLNKYFGGFRFDELFRSYAAEQGLVATAEQWSESRRAIDVHLRAYIGRNTVLEDTAACVLMAEIDTTLLKAVELLNETDTNVK